MTFDNVDELRKIAREHPGAQVVLRILTDDSASVCRLGLKFGAPLAAVPGLLQAARELGLDVAGVSYHVGSGNGRAESFADAVRDARAAFDIAARMGMPLRLLDIGGGFPGSDSGIDLAEAERAPAAGAADESNPYGKHPSFRAIASKVRAALDEHFPEGCGVDIIAEPGRFFVKSTHTLAVNVVGKRATADEQAATPAAAEPQHLHQLQQGAHQQQQAARTRWNYYVNDGLYGSFNCVLYDHSVAFPNIVLKGAAVQQQRRVAETEIDISRIDVRASRAGAPAPLAVQPLHSVVQNYYAHAAEEHDAGAASAGLEHLASAVRAATRVAMPRQQLQMRGMSTSASAPASSEFGPLYATTLWGPTCDSIDKITDATVLPELDIGDWLVFENMGAYTIAGSCRFNGFPLATKVYKHLDGSLTVAKEEETP